MEINRLIRLALIIASLVLLGMSAWWWFSSPADMDEQQLTKVPVFEFPLIGRSGVVTRHQFKGRYLVVSYFNPDCSHCRKLASTVGQKPTGIKIKKGGKEVRLGWLWVTRFDEDQAWKFMEQYGLKDKPDTWLAADREGNFYRSFGDMHVPSLYVFDPSGNFLEAVYDEPLYADVLKIIGGGRAQKPKKVR
jgi:hypothetical protein